MAGFSYTLASAEDAPGCDHCGEKLAYNSKTAGQPDTQGNLMNGWYHHDSMKRDHEATPPFGTSGEDLLASHNARRDQAKMQMRDHLSRQFDQVRLGKAADRAVNGF